MRIFSFIGIGVVLLFNNLRCGVVLKWLVFCLFFRWGRWKLIWLMSWVLKLIISGGEIYSCFLLLERWIVFLMWNINWCGLLFSLMLFVLCSRELEIFLLLSIRRLILVESCSVVVKMDIGKYNVIKVVMMLVFIGSFC